MQQEKQSTPASVAEISREKQQGRISDGSRSHESGERVGRESPSTDSDEGRDDDVGVRRPPRFPRMLVVENKGNVARDHLSVERTFLAYVRTSLICVTAGVGIIQLLTVTPSDVPLRLDRFGKVLGSVTEALGMTILTIAVIRYFSVQKALLDGKYPVANLLIWLILVALVSISLILFGLMLGITLS